VPLSVEALVDPARDALWTLDLVDGDVQLSRRPWERKGDAGAWLTSDVFDLPSTRSREGEALLSALQALYARGQADPESVSPEELRAMDERLSALLPTLDPIFARWMAFKDALRRVPPGPARASG
jgi:hypothetical protein